MVQVCNFFLNAGVSAAQTLILGCGGRKEELNVLEQVSVGCQLLTNCGVLYGKWDRTKPKESHWTICCQSGRFFSYLLVESGSLIEADSAFLRYFAQHTAY